MDMQQRVELNRENYRLTIEAIHKSVVTVIAHVLMNDGRQLVFGDTFRTGVLIASHQPQ